jgi:hypothetical protein
MTDVAARLEYLERSIAAMVHERPSKTEDTANSLKSESGQSTAPTSAVALTGRPNSSLPPIDQAAERPLYQDFLGKDGRYINEPLLSRVLEKEQELQCAIGSPSDASSPRRPPMLRAEGLIANSLLMQTDLKGLYPSRWQATLLWQTFINRVDPLVKVIHVPSTQSRIFAAINRPDSVRADVRALLFAIYFAASTALFSDDTQNETIMEDLQRYKQGMEISLHHAEFLDSPTITSLQAMVIYQVRDCCFLVLPGR